MAWIFLEYGLKVEGTQIAQVKRGHGLATRPRPEGLGPVLVPPEKEIAIVAALRHFGLL